VPAKSATAVMGATLGGCGSKRTSTATIIKLISTVSFLLKRIIFILKQSYIFFNNLFIIMIKALILF
jgi:hypothetical protein